MRPDDQEQLDRVVALVRSVLGGDGVAAYLFGSAALGGLRPESDLDVLALSERPTTSEQKAQLVGRLLAIAGRPLRRVELTVVVRGDVVPWRYPPRFDFQYGDWLRPQFERGDLEPWPSTNPDVASLIAMVLLADRPLFGPPPAEVLDAPPQDDLVRAMTGELDALLTDLESDTRNVVLTLARVWTTVESGAIRSKDAAAAWALPRLPEEHRPVLERARTAYLGGGGEPWDDLAPRLVPFAEHVLAAIASAGGGIRTRTPARGTRF